MQREELKEGTNVFTADGDQLGEISRFVLDPETNEVTHIVVKKGWLFSEDKVVPFDKVRSVSDEGLVLSEEIEDYDQLPPFEEMYFAETSARDRYPDEVDSYSTYPAGPAYYWYPPHGYLGYPGYGLAAYGWPYALTKQNIPADTVPLEEGTNVISSDGEHVGAVERLLVDNDTHMVTHFVISQGLFFKDHKLVPANWIRTVTEDEVQLHVSSKLLERLPTYEPD